MVLRLFEGSDSSDEDTNNKIEINEEFARRYEHNKKREDLQRLEELKKKGHVDNSSDTESDESSEESSEFNLVSRKKDLEFFEALIKVKNQDPVLKNKEAKLFESESESEKEDADVKQVEEESKRRKPMYLKDVTARHLIEEGPEFEEREEKMVGVKSYFEEQEDLKREFLDAVDTALEDDDGEEDLLKVKEKENKYDENENDGNAGEIDEKLDEYFGDDEKLDENGKFLKDYFRNKMWLDGGESGGRKGLDEGFGVSEDEEEIERQEGYERDFNFRFEENAGDRVMGHSRVVDGSVRKKKNARKLQRKSKEERLALAEFERKEELKHLKNLKKKEMNEKLRKIRETAGIAEDGNCQLDVDDLEEEFDPEEYDRKMKKAFDDDYYKANDADPEFASDEDGDEFEKPDFDKEDELLGLPKGWDDVLGSGDGFLAARERSLKHKVDNGVDNEQILGEDKEEDEEIVSEEGKRKKKRKRSHLEEEVLNKELEEYYKLDYEDTIGDLKTRFRYRPVNGKRYGLKTEEVLLMDDKELNQYVSLKKLAPYREKEWKVPRIKTYNQKLRNKSLLEGDTINGQDTSKKARNDGKSSGKKLERQPEVSNNDMNNLSRKSRRRHRQADLKLSHSRLMAYGKIPSKPKKKHKTSDAVQAGAL